MFMQDELDEFDFSLAELIGTTVADMRERITNQEYLQWRALAVVRRARAELDAKTTARR